MRLRLLCMLTTMLAVALPAAAEVERFSVLANAEKVGHLVVSVEAGKATVDYQVVDNGRGPKLKEQLALGPEGTPTSWTIEGSSTFGSPVHEHYSWTAGTATWVSAADQGSVAAPRLGIYVSDDASPWILGVYVRALQKAHGRSLQVLPSGQLRLEELRRITLGQNGRSVGLTIYAILGLGLDPEYVLMDAQNELFGRADGTLLREGYESLFQQLQKISHDIGVERAQQAQRQLAHRFDGPVRIRNVRVFNPQSMSLEPSSCVLVYRDRISAVGSECASIPSSPDETVIEGEGGTLVPGLHDMHHHISLPSCLYSLAAGVTTVRDMGNDNSELLAVVDGLESGQLAGPRIFRNGLLEGRSPYSVRLGFVADTLDQALTDVRWYAAHGYFEVKIYNSLPPDWVAPVAAEAHRLGMGVTGHVPALSSPDRVIREGYNSIAHVNQLMLGWLLQPGEDTRTPLRLTAMSRARGLDLASPAVRQTIEAMKARHVALDTTVVALEQLMLSRAGTVGPGDRAYLDHMPIGYQRYRRRSFVTINNQADDETYKRSFEKLLATLELLDQQGIQLLPGTDDSNGFAVPRELELYVAAGIPAGKALQLATLDAARYLRDESLGGSIERGRLADLTLVRGDPLADIHNIRQVRMTMRGGVVYFPSEIYDYLAVQPFESPPTVRSPRL